MKRLALLFAFVCLLISNLNATVPVSGHLKNPNSSASALNTFLRFELLNCPGNPRVVGSGVLVPTKWDIRPNSSGLIADSIYGNNEIDCSGAKTSLWKVTPYFNNVAGVSLTYSITGAFNYDVPPNPTIPPAQSGTPIHSFRFIGAWDDAINYKSYDVVTYNGQTFNALVDNVNVVPVDGSTWALMAAKGQDGSGGGGSSTWGNISGDLQNQSDVITALAGKVAIPSTSTVAGLSSIVNPYVGMKIPVTDGQRGDYCYLGSGNWMPCDSEINVRSFGAIPLDHAYGADGTATGGSTTVAISGFSCTSSMTGRQLWLAGSGAAGADVTYSITGCSGNNFSVSPAVVTSVVSKATAVGKTIDSSPAMNSLLSYCMSMSNYPKGCTVNFPGNVAYGFMSTIQISGYGPAQEKAIFKCPSGEGGTYLVWLGADQGNLIQVGGTITNDYPTFEISHCSLQGIDNVNHRPVAIYFKSAGVTSLIERNHFGNTWNGVRITNSFYWQIDHNYFQGSADSCILLDTSGGQPISNSTISNNEINYCGAWGIGDFSGAGSDTLRVISNDIEGNGGYLGGIRIAGSNPYVVANRSEMTSCINDGSYRALYYQGGNWGGGTFIGNQWFGCGSNTLHQVEVGGSGKNLFSNNTYGTSVGTTLALNNFTMAIEPGLAMTDISNCGSLCITGNPSIDSATGNKTMYQLPGISMSAWSGVNAVAGKRNAAFITVGSFGGGGSPLTLLASSPGTFSGTMPPSASSTNQTLTGGDLIWNSSYAYGPGAPRSQFPGWVARGTPVWNGAAWTGGTFDYLQSSKCLTVDSTAVPTTGTWSTCDFVRNTNPSTGISGWLNTAGGTPGTWVAQYTTDLSAPPAIGATTPNTVKGTTINAATGFQLNGVAALDTFLQGNGTNFVASGSLPSCSNGTTDKLLYNATSHTFTCGTDQSTGSGLSNPMNSTGDIIYSSDGSGTPARLAGNSTTTKKFLTSTGTGAAAQAPAYGTIDWADVSKTGSSLADFTTRTCSTLSDSGTGCTANISLYAPLASPTFTGTVGGITAAMVGALPSTTVIPANTTATGSNFFTAYDNTTGAFTKAQPAVADLSDAANVVKKNAANTWSTGVQNMSAADALVVPTLAGLNSTTNGYIGYDSTANEYSVGVNGFNKRLAMKDSNITGSAAKWTTPRNLAGNSVDGSANVNFSNKFIVQGTADAGLSGAQFLGSLGTGLLKNTTTTGVLSVAVSTDILGLWSGTCNASTFLRGDGSCQAVSGSGTVTVVGAGSLTSTALVTGGGGSAIQTPAGTATMDSSGNISTPGTVTASGITISGAAGADDYTQIAAPASPAASHLKAWADSTDARFHDKNPAGTIGTTVVADTGTANSFFSAMSAAGVFTKTRPTCSTLSDAGTLCSSSAALPVTKTAASGQPLLSYDSTTGAFTQGALTATNVGLGSVTNDAQTKAAVVPNTLTAHALYAGNGTSAISAISVPAADSVLYGTTAADPIFKALPTTGTNGCSGTGDKLLFNTSTHAFSCGVDQTAAGGTGDFSSNTSTSVLGEVVVFADTTGKIGARATGTGVAKLASGVLSASAVDLSGGDVTGTLASARFPALTGAITNTAGTVATVPGKVDALLSNLSCTDAVGTDAYACNLSPAITAYAQGIPYCFKAGTANTGAASIALNGLAALTIKKPFGGTITTDLADNDIKVGQYVCGFYDGTNFQMTTQVGNAPAGAGTVNAGTAGHIAYYVSSTAAVSDGTVVAADITTYHTPATGIARTTSGSQAIASSELSGDVTTSGSNATVLATKYKRISIVCYIGATNGSALADTDDEPNVYRAPEAFHVTAIYANADAGSPTIQVTKNSATNVLSAASLTATQAFATSSSFTAGADAFAAGDILGCNVVAAGGTAKQITVQIDGTVD